jgi:uncharacterized protein with von Willebrand factor type A (vWA) domain
VAWEASLLPVLLERVAHDYHEMLDLRLTPAQARRLWDIDGPTCAAVLTALVDTGVLQRASDGRFELRRAA